jgi:hypothetical protein
VKKRKNVLEFNVGPLVEAYLDSQDMEPAEPLIDLTVWRQADTGVYFHRSEPRMLLVQQELDREKQWPVHMTDVEWMLFMQWLLRHICWESAEPGLSVRPLQEMQICRRASYVV